MRCTIACKATAVAALVASASTSAVSATFEAACERNSSPHHLITSRVAAMGAPLWLAEAVAGLETACTSGIHKNNKFQPLSLLPRMRVRLHIWAGPETTGTAGTCKSESGYSRYMQK